MSNNDSSDPMDQVLPNNIAKFRKALGLSQDELAARLKISVTQLSRLERGVSSLKHTRFKAFAEALQVEPEELFLSRPRREGIDLDVIREIIVQLDQLLRRLDIEPSPEQRADLTVEIYRLETDGLETEEMRQMKIDLRKYEGMLRSMAKK